MTHRSTSTHRLEGKRRKEKQLKQLIFRKNMNEFATLKERRLQEKAKSTPPQQQALWR
jgi:hypothetical protein